MESHNEPDYEQILARIETMLGVPQEEVSAKHTLQVTTDKLNGMIKLFADRDLGATGQKLTGPISFELNRLFKLLNERRDQ